MFVLLVRHIGELPPKDKALLEERLKRVTVAPPVITGGGGATKNPVVPAAVAAVVQEHKPEPPVEHA